MQQDSFDEIPEARKRELDKLADAIFEKQKADFLAAEGVSE